MALMQGSDVTQVTIQLCLCCIFISRSIITVIFVSAVGIMRLLEV